MKRPLLASILAVAVLAAGVITLWLVRHRRLQHAGHKRQETAARGPTVRVGRHPQRPRRERIRERPVDRELDRHVPIGRAAHARVPAAIIRVNAE